MGGTPGVAALIAAVLMLCGIVAVGMGGRNADGTPRSLIWAVAAALFFLSALWFCLGGIGIAQDLQK